MVDKGWLQAVDHFAQCIQTGQKPLLADAADALKAAQITHAAIQSRSSGQVVKL